MEWVTTKCGGVRVRTHPDHSVELEGQGFPIYVKGSREHRYLEQTWRNFRWLFRLHSLLKGVPVSNLLAIATQETGPWSDSRQRQATIGSPAGALGVMQVMPCAIFQNGIYKDLVCGRDRADPNVSIDIGSTLLKAKLDSTKALPFAASSYNAGGIKCYTGAHESNPFGLHHEQNYALKVTKYNNAAVVLGVNNVALPIIGTALTAAAAGALLYLAKKGKLQKLLRR